MARLDRAINQQHDVLSDGPVELGHDVRQRFGLLV